MGPTRWGLADDVVVMQQGRVEEAGPAARVLGSPQSGQPAVRVHAHAARGGAAGGDGLSRVEKGPPRSFMVGQLAHPRRCA